MSASFYQIKPEGLVLHCQIQAGRKDTGFADVHDGCIKIRLQSPAIDGKANKALQLFLSQQFNCPKTAVRLLKGHKSPLKTVLVSTYKIWPEALAKERNHD